MSKLNDLINKLCPDGVYFVKLGEVCEIKTGRGITQKDCSDAGEYPVYSGGKEPMGYYHKYNRDENTVTVSRVGAYAGYVNFVFQKFYLNDKCFSVIPIQNNINGKYLFYKLKSIEQIIINLQSGGGVPTINTKKVGSLEIPLPPMEVQNEIVRILDCFTQLEAELEAELDCRKRQYEFYRDQLLSFDKLTPPERNNVVWKKLSEVGTLVRGNGLQKKDFTPNGVGCIHYGQIYTHYRTFATETITCCSEELAKKLRTAEYGDVVIATTSENVEDVCKAVAWLGKESIAISGDAYIYKHNQNPKYIAYIFQTGNFFDYKKRKANGTKVIRLSGDAIGKYEVPLPPIEEQNRIVAILDRFESLTTSLQHGLPAEIAARRQQYEYYRDKLLDFKRKTA